MTERLEIGFLIFSVISMLGGIVLSYYALHRYGKVSAPKGISLNVRDWWRPVWKTRDLFKERKGFHFYVLGTLMISAGCLLAFVVFAFRF